MKGSTPKDLMSRMPEGCDCTWLSVRPKAHNLTKWCILGHPSHRFAVDSCSLVGTAIALKIVLRSCSNSSL